MLNLADLGVLLATAIGGLCAAAGASAEGATSPVAVAVGAGGVIVGLALGLVASRLYYWLLDRKPAGTLLSMIAFVGYSVWPIAVGLFSMWVGGNLAAVLE